MNDKEAFKMFVLEKMPAINKTVIEEFMASRNINTMKDFLNRYDKLTQDTIQTMHDEIMEYLTTEF